ncbi:hypothetical protein KRMM14A1004_49220 [Krasilnikovia sp. MM14-A1004]
MWLLADQFVSAFAEASGPFGWRGRPDGDDEFVIFSKPLDSEIYSELGLDLTERDFGLSLNPSVSVRHERASDLHAQFFGFEQGPSQVAASLSDLARHAGRGSGMMRTVERIEDINVKVREVLSDIAELGEQFYARYSTMPDLVRYLEGSARTSLELGQLALAYALTGDREKADSVLSKLEEIAAQQPTLPAAQTTRFLDAFRAYFENFA